MVHCLFSFFLIFDKQFLFLYDHFRVVFSFLKRSCLGGSSDEGTPDPIPNSEVKLISADGTWTLGPGRVGRRQDRVFSKSKSFLFYKRGGFLVCFLLKK